MLSLKIASLCADKDKLGQSQISKHENRGVGLDICFLLALYQLGIEIFRIQEFPRLLDV